MSYISGEAAYFSCTNKDNQISSPM